MRGKENCYNSQMYYSQQVFDEHVKTIHHMEKNYKCEPCNESFSQAV